MSSGLTRDSSSDTSEQSARSSGRIDLVSLNISDSYPHDRNMARISRASLLIASPFVYPAEI